MEQDPEITLLSRWEGEDQTLKFVARTLSLTRQASDSQKVGKGHNPQQLKFKDHSWHGACWKELANG